MPRFSMPESSTASRAAATEPAPARSVYRLDMSDRTPILITLSDICACAAPAPSAAATARPSMVRLMPLMTSSSRVDAMRLALASGFRRLQLSASDAEIGMQLRHVGVELRVVNHVDDPAVLHHVVTVGDGRREMEILLDQQDGEALRLQPRDGAPDLLHDDGREAFGRLVQHQQAREIGRASCRERVENSEDAV